jgi:hypothetical protein
MIGDGIYMNKKETLIALIALASILSCTTIFYLYWTMPVQAPFFLHVIPVKLMGDSIPGQRCVFLVTVEENETESGESKAVTISATATGAIVIVEQENIAPGQVAEVTVIPDIESAGSNITVTIRGERDGLERTTAVTFTVLEVDSEEEGSADELGQYAAEIRDMFIQWLAVNHPELGITGETNWTGTIVSPRWLVVTHYLFFSEDWEMHVSWHIMIPPYDWAKIDLRHRFTESQPSYAFEIPSLTAQDEPHAVDPPETVWR